MNHTKYYPSFLVLFFLLFSLSACTSMGVKEIPLHKLNAKYATGESRYMNVGDVLVHYRDEGEGPTVLLLHGMVSSLHTWDAWTKDLTDNYRVVRLDMPGFALTGPFPSNEYNIEAYMQFIDQFIEKLGLKDVVIVGNSLGGYFAWYYTYLHPEKIKGLTLIDSAGYPQKTPWIVGLADVPVAGKVGAWITPKWLVSMNLKDVYGNPDLLTDEIIDRYFELVMRPGIRKSSMKIFQLLNQSSKDPNLGQEIKNIKKPTLLMWGAEDIWIPVSMLDDHWRKDLPHAEVVIYDGVGHLPMEEAPERSVVDFKRFLESLD